jgi:triacylglycerol lipase
MNPVELIFGGIFFAPRFIRSFRHDDGSDSARSAGTEFTNLPTLKGDIDMPTFDPQFSRLLLEICRFTYAAGFDDAVNAADKKDALNWIKNVGGLLTREPVILHGSSTSVACVAAYPDRNVVAYMGTKTQFDTLDNAIASIEDWFQNFEHLLVPFKLTSEQLGPGYPTNTDKNNLGGKVHQGFLEELRSVQGLLVEELLKNGGRSRPVYVTGHSQGGAIAALATRALLAGGFPVVSTYTFAAPRPGNAVFAASIPAMLPVHRIEFGDDIVPHVPPTVISKEALAIVDGLKLFPLLPDHVQKLLDFVKLANKKNGFTPVGRLCYGSQKTKALRIDLSAEQEAALFPDRMWSLIRHPDHWADHHHLVGTADDVKKGIKGNYTALVSEFPIVS